MRSMILVSVLVSGCYASAPGAPIDTNDGGMLDRYYIAPGDPAPFEEAWRRCQADGSDVARFDAEEVPYVEAACTNPPCWTGNVVFGAGGSSSTHVFEGSGWVLRPTHAGPWLARALCERF